MNNKNKILVTLLILGIICVFLGAFLKVFHINGANFFLSFGLALEVLNTFGLVFYNLIYKK